MAQISVNDQKVLAFMFDPFLLETYFAQFRNENQWRKIMSNRGAEYQPISVPSGFGMSNTHIPPFL